MMSSAKKTVFQNVKIFDGEDVLHENGQVVVQGSKILSVGPTSGHQTSSDVEVVDGTGKTLMPSIIDCHVHIYNKPIMQESCIDWGITTFIGWLPAGLPELH